MLGPRTRKALTELCAGKWSAFGVLCTMRQLNWDPEVAADDQKMADKVVRQDLSLMGVS